MGVMAFQDGFTGQMRRVMVGERLGHIQVHHADYPGRRSMHDALPKASERAAALQARPEVAALTMRLRGPALIGGEVKSVGGVLTGVDPALEEGFTHVSQMLTEGRYLGQAPAHEVVLGFKLAQKIEVEVGEQVVVVTQAADGTMGNDLYTVVGLLSTGNDQVDRLGGHIHLADLQALLVMEGRVHEITLITRPDTDLDAFAATIQAGTAGDDAVVRTWREVDPKTAEMLTMQDSMNGLIMMIILSVAGIVILNTMMMVVFERTRELGVLKALGMRPAHIVSLVLLESLCLTTLAVSMGLVLGGLIDWFLVSQGVQLLEGDLTFAGVRLPGHMFGVVRVAPIVQTVGFAYVVSLIAALWPAVRASRLDPVIAMRSE
jgi:ABC-type lipoprotein release transport system permease subunit